MDWPGLQAIYLAFSPGWLGRAAWQGATAPNRADRCIFGFDSQPFRR